MKPLAGLIALAALPLLSACFVSETPHIAEGESLARGPIALCTPDDPPCRIALPSGDGYIVASEDGDEEDLLIRFEALAEAGGAPVWLGEVELREDGQSAWSYIVARPVAATVGEAPRFDVAMPGCGDLAPEREAEAGVERADAYSCTVTDMARFRAYLNHDYADRFADPAWWADAN
jgi:hypothetical protein